MLFRSIRLAILFPNLPATACLYVPPRALSPFSSRYLLSRLAAVYPMPFCLSHSPPRKYIALPAMMCLPLRLRALSSPSSRLRFPASYGMPSSIIACSLCVSRYIIVQVGCGRAIGRRKIQFVRRGWDGPNSALGASDGRGLRWRFGSAYGFRVRTDRRLLFKSFIWMGMFNYGLGLGQ